MQKTLDQTVYRLVELSSDPPRLKQSFTSLILVMTAIIFIYGERQNPKLRDWLLNVRKKPMNRISSKQLVPQKRSKRSATTQDNSTKEKGGES